MSLEMKHPVKSLIALNVLTLGISLLMFGAGIFSSAMVRKQEASLRSAPQAVFEAALEKRIGKPYTKDVHESFASYLRSNDEMIWSSVESMSSYSTVMFQMGGAIALIGMANVFLLWKTKRAYDAAKSIPCHE